MTVFEERDFWRETLIKVGSGPTTVTIPSGLNITYTDASKAFLQAKVKEFEQLCNAALSCNTGLGLYFPTITPNWTR